MDYVIETKNLTKEFKNQIAVDSINIKLEKGKIYGLLGKNGAGKTTTMSMILNLINPNNGEIKLFGCDYKKNPEIYLKIGSIIEAPGFYENLTAFENLKVFSKLRGNYNKNNILKALKIVSLNGETKKLFKNYSLGMKQRLGIAFAIYDFPELLILDEPINGLDPVGIQEIRELFRNLVDDYNMTILISSHILSEVEAIADIIGIMDEGKLIEEISIVDLQKKLNNYVDFELSDYNLGVKTLVDLGLTYDEFELKNINGYRFLRIYNYLDKRSDINEAFVKCGIKVNKLYLSSESLEEYFIGLIN